MFRKLTAILLTLVAVLAAGWLALRRPDVPYDTLENTYKLPASNFVTIHEDLKVHFTDTGPRDAPVLVLLHGYASSVYTWRQWQEQLDEDYRVIALDLPGHGLSRVPHSEPVDAAYYAETLGAFADKIGLERFSLAGSSMGGRVAWTYADEHPDRLDSLILVDASGWPLSREARSQSPLVFKILRYPLARIILRDLDVSELIKSGLEKSFADPAFVTEEMTERYSAFSRAPGHRGALLQLAAEASDRDADLRERLSALNMPTLVLWGEQDRIIPVSHAEKFGQTIPNAVTITYADVGHLQQEELPGQSAADVRAFLDRQVAGVPLVNEDVATNTTETEPTGVASGGSLRPH